MADFLPPNGQARRLKALRRNNSMTLYPGQTAVLVQDWKIKEI